jgi:tetratricopeptide (TPR) repeat protein
MPVPVEADFEDGTSELRWTDRFVRLNVLRFESRSPLKEVRLDPEGRLAIISESIPRSPEEIAEAVNNLDWTGTAEAALEILHRPETAGIKTAHVWFKLGLLLYDGRHYPEAFEAFQTYTRLAGSDGEFFGGFVWMGIIKDLLGERNEALTFYRDALKHDPGLTLQHDQYNLRIDRAWVEARLKTPFKRD